MLMIATNVEEALLNLFHTCQRAARTFSTCAESSRIAPLRAALAARSQHCRQVAGGLRPFLAPSRTRTAMASTEWQALPSEASDADVLRVYEVCEGYVLASYRDLVDIGLPPALSALLLPQFELALRQYVDIVAQCTPLRGRPRALRIEPATVAARGENVARRDAPAHPAHA
jgi:hypothetical protein